MSNELVEHVRELAHDLNVRVWVSITGPGPWGMAVEPEPGEDQPLVWLGTMPDTATAYIVALHELGHHADPEAWTGYRLDREAYAWQWALDHSRIEPDLDVWRMIYAGLASYDADRRYRKTDAFLAQLEAARTAIARCEQQVAASAAAVRADLARWGASATYLDRRADSPDSPSV